jgi:hypothetical protein
VVRCLFAAIRRAAVMAAAAPIYGGRRAVLGAARHGISRRKVACKNAALLPTNSLFAQKKPRMFGQMAQICLSLQA